MKHTDPDAWKGEQFIRVQRVEPKPGEVDPHAPHGRCRALSCLKPLSVENMTGYCRNHVGNHRHKKTGRRRKSES